jgi:hypothetical protein
LLRAAPLILSAWPEKAPVSSGLAGTQKNQSGNLMEPSPGDPILSRREHLKNLRSTGALARPYHDFKKTNIVNILLILFK